MSRFQELRMIDILSNVDMALLEGEFPEMDLSNEDLLSCLSIRRKLPVAGSVGMYSDQAFGLYQMEMRLPLQTRRVLSGEQQIYNSGSLNLTSDEASGGLQRRTEENVMQGMTCASQQERRGVLEQMDAWEHSGQGLSDNELALQRKKKVKKKLALLSGIAAGSIAVTGVIVLVCKKYDLLKKAA